jgi:hypothetical protein
VSFVQPSIDGFSAKATQWSDAWAVVADPLRFAARINSAVPGASRPVTADDIRELTDCGLIGKRGFFERADLETVRGILLYEQTRAARTRGTRDIGEATEQDGRNAGLGAEPVGAVACRSAASWEDGQR